MSSQDIYYDDPIPAERKVKRRRKIEITAYRTGADAFFVDITEKGDVERIFIDRSGMETLFRRINFLLSVG